MAPNALHLSNDLRTRLQAVSKLGQSTNNHALQVVCLQARVWAADENDQACRPWYILCLEIYPRGKVVNHRIHKPASLRPRPSDIFAFILDHMKSPPDGEASIRPTHVSFVDRDLELALNPHLTRLKIKCEHLVMADGVMEYMSKFSDRLVERGQATRGDSGERPGMMSGKGVTKEMIAALMRAATEMHEVQPWKRIPEHVALEVRLPSEGVMMNDRHLGSGGSSSSSNNNSSNTNSNGDVGNTIDGKHNQYADGGSMPNQKQSSRPVIDRKKIRNRDKFYVTVLGCDDSVYGFVLVSSLAMLRDKYRRVIGKRTGVDMSRTRLPSSSSSDDDDDNSTSSNNENTDHSNNGFCSALASDVLVCAMCGTRVGEEGPGTERWVNRCSACRRLYYCDEVCQYKDWGLRHMMECEAAQNDSEYVFIRPEWAWIDREVALLFLDPTAVPFDDLDGFTQHGWDAVLSTSPPSYPLPVVSVQTSDGLSSRRDVPTAKEIIALTHIANGLKECVSVPPNDGTLHLTNGLSVSLAENLAETIPLPKDMGI